MRIEAEARRRGADVLWKPFLLGPIFAAQGWTSSPFKIYPAKGAYMWRDMERRAALYGLEFHRPLADDPRNFPQHSVFAARIALVGLQEGWGQDFCKRVFLAEFGGAQDISDPQILAALAADAGAGPDVTVRAVSGEIKALLRTQSQDAMDKGLIGAPSFTVGDELFWGDDRLEDALDWAVQS